MVGLLAVFPFDDNFVALSAAEDYVVDWGDGAVPARSKSGSAAEHNYRTHRATEFPSAAATSVRGHGHIARGPQPHAT